MNASTSRVSAQVARGSYSTETAQSTPGVCWGAILAGAAGAAALSLTLLLLGMGLGLSSVSPWSNQGATATTMGLSTILWLTFTQLAASGMGGYMAGRLQRKWAVAHTDEVYFHNTAHGFITWAVATLLTVTLMTTTISSMVTKGGQAGASVAGATVGAGAAVAKNNASSLGDGMDYFVDSLFRKDISASTSSASAQSTGSETSAASSISEVTRIFSNSIRTNTLPQEDRLYVAHLVAQRTGITQADAEERVTAIFNKIQVKLKETEAAARESADKVRKASSYAAFWFSASLLSGAFLASFAAAYGGRRRDL